MSEVCQTVFFGLLRIGMAKVIYLYVNYNYQVTQCYNYSAHCIVRKHGQGINVVITLEAFES